MVEEALVEHRLDSQKLLGDKQVIDAFDGILVVLNRALVYYIEIAGHLTLAFEKVYDSSITIDSVKYYDGKLFVAYRGCDYALKKENIMLDVLDYQLEVLSKGSFQDASFNKGEVVTAFKLIFNYLMVVLESYNYIVLPLLSGDAYRMLYTANDNNIFFIFESCGPALYKREIQKTASGCKLIDIPWSVKQVIKYCKSDDYFCVQEFNTDYIIFSSENKISYFSFTDPSNYFTVDFHGPITSSTKWNDQIIVVFDDKSIFTLDINSKEYHPLIEPITVWTNSIQNTSNLLILHSPKTGLVTINKRTLQVGYARDTIHTFQRMNASVAAVYAFHSPEDNLIVAYSDGGDSILIKHEDDYTYKYLSNVISIKSAVCNHFNFKENTIILSFAGVYLVSYPLQVIAEFPIDDPLDIKYDYKLDRFIVSTYSNNETGISSLYILTPGLQLDKRMDKKAHFGFYLDVGTQGFFDNTKYYSYIDNKRKESFDVKHRPTDTTDFIYQHNCLIYKSAYNFVCCERSTGVETVTPRITSFTKIDEDRVLLFFNETVSVFDVRTKQVEELLKGKRAFKPTDINLHILDVDNKVKLKLKKGRFLTSISSFYTVIEYEST